MIHPTPTGVRLDIRVTPRASRTAVGGTHGGRLVVRVTAPPVDQAANDAALRALADAFGVPLRALRLVSGATSRNKVVEISGVSVTQLRGTGLFSTDPAR